MVTGYNGGSEIACESEMESSNAIGEIVTVSERTPIRTREVQRWGKAMARQHCSGCQHTVGGVLKHIAEIEGQTGSCVSANARLLAACRSVLSSWHVQDRQPTFSEFITRAA